VVRDVLQDLSKNKSGGWTRIQNEMIYGLEGADKLGIVGWMVHINIDNLISRILRG
jgi:hypothetical protein